MRLESRTIEETRQIGARCARVSTIGTIIALIGPLGAGKTEFVRGFAGAISPDDQVRSPSFPLLCVYDGGSIPLYHFDFYRLRNRSEMTEIGLHEYLDGNGICLIEWADLFPEELPTALVKTIRFSTAPDQTRIIESDFFPTELSP